MACTTIVSNCRAANGDPLLITRLNDGTLEYWDIRANTAFTGDTTLITCGPDRVLPDWPTPVEFAAGPGVTPSNAAAFAVNGQPTRVHVLDAPDGMDVIWYVVRAVDGAWQWRNVTGITTP